LLQLVKAEEQVDVIKKQATNQSTSHLQLIDRVAEVEKERDTLQIQVAELMQKGRDFDALKKQATSQQDEYMRLMDRYNALERRAEGRSEEVRKDT
jgi:chromosome segregation ATPase